MKLRIKGNSVRLRLTRSEVEKLARDNIIQERIEFHSGPLTYCIKAVEDLSCSRADFHLGTVTVSVPGAELEQWCSTDAVSIVGQHQAIKILVEKDFACLTEREGEDDSDAFAHPLAS